MATIEKRRNGYRLVFWYQSERFQGSVKANNDRDAKQLKAKVERNLQLLQEGRIEYRTGDDLFQLMISDGKLNAAVEVATRVSLEDFFGQYQAARPPGKENNTVYTENIHIRHLLRLLEEWLKVHPGGPYTFCKTAGEPMTEQMATHYLRWTLEKSKWQVIRGWHVFRHSLISNLACRGISERIIMGIAGHLNRETTRRYAHLTPSTVQDAIRVVFG